MAANTGWGQLRMAAREITAAMYANAIWRSGDMTTADDELRRKVVEKVYREQVPAQAAASWLGITRRGLTKMASRPPRRSTGKRSVRDHVMDILTGHPGKWFSPAELYDEVRDRGLVTSETEIEDTLIELRKVEQVIEQRSGQTCRYRSADWVRRVSLRDPSRKRGIMQAVECLPEILEQVLGQVEGAGLSSYRYSLPKGREADILDEVRAAVSEVLRRHEAAAAASGEEAQPVTVMMMGGLGWLGTAAQPSDEEVG